MLIQDKVIDFINKVDEKTPTPGGGSVSALASSIGTALVGMVSHLTIDKKKFLNLDEDIKTKFNETIEFMGRIKNRLATLVDKDSEAYNLVSNAFKLPRKTDEEKAFRKEEIEKATLEAIKAPYEIAAISAEALRQMEHIVPYGNVNTISDLGVATLLLAAGGEGACMNVLINLPGLSDEGLKTKFKNDVDKLLKEYTQFKNTYLKVVYENL